ncbi:hypothetical protein FRC03_009380 [Tulasnella sp. 419]|nr:hypothetical protein FRC02_001570 [Tulasnella sp. 418]KAG8958179.1 hypothetical protein FRC03_009380 [Tulasnella sp. 419]
MPSSKRALAKDPSFLSVVSEDDDDDSDAESTSTLTSGIEHHDSVPSSSFPAASSIQNILDGPVLPHPDEPPQLHEKRKLSAMLCDLANVSDGDTDVEDPSPSQSSPKKARTASQVYDPRTQTAKVFCQWTDPLDGTKCGCGFISSSELRKHLERTHVVREIQYFHHQYIPITQARALILITLLRLDRTEPNRRTKKWKELTYQVIMVKSSILSMTLDQAEWDSGKFNHFLEEMSRTVVIMATPLTCLSCGQKFETGKKARTEFNRHVAACSVTSSPKKSGLRKEKKYQDDSKKLRWA